MTAHRELKFYATHPHTCSYLKEEEATTLFMDPQEPLDQSLYTQLVSLGFRRSGPHVYQPYCKSCKRCIPARVPVDDFRMQRTQRKCWNKNQDLTVSAEPVAYTEEIYDLYENYINEQHTDGDMFPASREQFMDFLIDSPDFCRFYHFRLKDQLIAVAVTDRMDNGLSAIYTFYNPEFTKRSLGRFCILWQIHETRRLRLQYLHLGYWIKNCRKMAYKTEYQPLDIYKGNQWVSII
ncbi:putative arginyl-tRNA--protein transferase [invertebrate metagenome]|uniref:Putative arginyl-tRNA--protein transferase n=1 Tax=invertebrate metagenome TaxID=1711999 RepID=A0A2H9T7Q9_9ZZZZ